MSFCQEHDNLMMCCRITFTCVTRSVINLVVILSIFVKEYTGKIV